MADCSGVNKLMGMLECVAGQHGTDFKEWYERRGKDLMVRLEETCDDAELCSFVDAYAECLVDSVVNLLKVHAESTVAEISIDMMEELAGQAFGRAESLAGERADEALAVTGASEDVDSRTDLLLAA